MHGCTAILLHRTRKRNLVHCPVLRHGRYNYSIYTVYISNPASSKGLGLYLPIMLGDANARYSRNIWRDPQVRTANVKATRIIPAGQLETTRRFCYLHRQLIPHQPVLSSNGYPESIIISLKPINPE